MCTIFYTTLVTNFSLKSPICDTLKITYLLIRTFIGSNHVQKSIIVNKTALVVYVVHLSVFSIYAMEILAFQREGKVKRDNKKAFHVLMYKK